MLWIGLGSAIVGGCAPPRSVAAPEGIDAAAEVSDPALREMLSVVDRQVDPCESFYAFACGGMQPSDAGNSTEDQLYFRLDDRLWAFMTAPTSEPPTDPTTKAIRSWVATCRDDTARTAAGTSALAPLLQHIDTVVDAPSFMAAAGALQAQGVSSLLGLVIAPGPDNRYAPRFHGPQSPWRLEGDPELERAVALVAKALAIVDRSQDPAGRAREVLRFEARLVAAEVAWEQSVDTRTWAAHPAWGPYLASLGQALPTTTRVDDVAYLDAVAGAVGTTKPEVLRDYLRWMLLLELKLDLPLGLQFDGPFEAGTNAYCAVEAERRFPVHLARGFGPLGLGDDERQRARALFERIRRARIARLDPPWADAELAAGARAILERIEPRIGWIDEPWGELPVPSTDHLANALAARAFAVQGMLASDHRASNGLAWEEPQFQATAWNDAAGLTIDVGLGILQPPLFDGERPAHLDVAALGFVIAHELHHSIGPGHLAEHLEQEGVAASAAAPIVEVAECFDRAYAAKGTELPEPRAEDGSHLEEILADVAALRLSLALHRESLPAAAPSAAGLSADALFFISAMRLFCTAVPESEDPRIAGAHRRFDAVMAVLPEFAQTFACEAEDPLRIEHDCTTW